MHSRLMSVEKQRTAKTIIWSLFFVGAVGVAMFYFGVPLLIQLAVFMSDMNNAKNVQVVEQQQSLVAAPILDALPESTPSATISVSGFAPANSSVILIVNGEKGRPTLSGANGEFTEQIVLSDGENTVAAQTVDENDQESPLSQTITIIKDTVPPELTITQPTDNAQLNGQQAKTLTIQGKTETECRIAVNGRFASVSSDGAFSFHLDLHQDDNPIDVIATDKAGNQTLAHVNVTWQP